MHMFIYIFFFVCKYFFSSTYVDLIYLYIHIFIYPYMYTLLYQHKCRTLPSFYPPSLLPLTLPPFLPPFLLPSFPSSYPPSLPLSLSCKARIWKVSSDPWHGSEWRPPRWFFHCVCVCSFVYFTVCVCLFVCRCVCVKKLYSLMINFSWLFLNFSALCFIHWNSPKMKKTISTFHLNESKYFTPPQFRSKRC